jgi:hypothetical protein
MVTLLWEMALEEREQRCRMRRLSYVEAWRLNPALLARIRRLA